jgi:hypothetical protein
LEQQLLDEMSFLAEASGLSEVQSDLTEIQASLTLEIDTNSEQEEAGESAFSSIDTQDYWLSEDTEEQYAQAEAQDEDGWETYVNDESEPSKDVVLPPSNWPSPTLYPYVPQRGANHWLPLTYPVFPVLNRRRV